MHILRHRTPCTSVLLTLVALLLSSCNQDLGDYVRPMFTDYTVPGQVILSFPKKDKIPDTRFSIDHINHRIYNLTPLPYGTVVDSAYVQMVLSNQLTTTFENVTTGESVEYKNDTTKIDFKGGLMKLTLRGGDKKNAKTVTYDFRVLTYGYDPNKIAWTDIRQGLPVATDEARLIQLSSDRSYLLTRLGEETTLLQIASYEPLQIVRVATPAMPKGLRPYSAYTSSDDVTWALDGEGQLYCSTDLMSWSAIDLSGVTPTQILSAGVGHVYLIGEKDAAYHIYRYTTAPVELKALQEVEASFPVRDSYVYEYAISGTPHMLLFGGYEASGRPVRTGFFSSDLAAWGAIPSSATYPVEGGLYVPTPDRKTLFRIGGVYADGRQTTILKSDDNGVTWTKMEAGNLPDKDFLPLSHAAGCYRVSPSGESLYIFGGKVGAEGRPSTQIWHGMIDRSAGIINAFDKK